ncbi:hypothetical protein IG631_07774 [Alternaria alternata]|nr:hypothetical protein IG631_07774 [Alternaria alternata]
MMPKIAYQFDRELSLVALKVLRLFTRSLANPVHADILLFDVQITLTGTVQLPRGLARSASCRMCS